MESLLYLMVLTDCRTISKSISNYDNTEDVYDAVTDLYYTTNHKLKHIHKHKRLDKNENIKPMHSRMHAKVSKPHSNSKIYGRDVKTETKDSKIYPVLTTTKLTEKTTERLKPKTPKHRVGSYWRKFRNKLKYKRTKEPVKKLTVRNRELNQLDSNANYFNGRSKRKNSKHFVLKRSNGAEAIKMEVNKDTNVPLTKRFSDDKASYKAGTTKMKSESRTHHQTHKGRESTPANVSLTAELDAITTEILHLKQLYPVDKYMTATIPTPAYEYTSTVFETDFPGTAQIEELLNDIKSKAIQMIAEQSPSVTDIISNTVTEATFDADPILVRAEIDNPGYAFTTFVTINEVDNTINKRIVDQFEDIPIETTSTEHAVHLRSIGADAMTIAQSVEDMLQKELKLVINKVKTKISHGVKQGKQKPKPTIGHHAHLKTKTTPMATESKTEATFQKKITESTTIRSRENKNRKNGKATHTTEDTTHQTTLDDYVMLTLYEEILSKRRDDNVMKMVTSNDSPLQVKKRNHYLLSKRNLETITDLKLKEDIKKLYDNTADMPEYDYSVESLILEDSTERTDTPSIGTKSTDDKIYDDPRTVADLEDTSYEALSNKIAYNDFVNGYKHYLKFQKEQANTNFSNMVRYQAHRHHNVDDIGKFILNKIPPLPHNRDRRFFDYTDIDDQEVSTKSDDSWFKKHFYIFTDYGPPKKFHTSQTVSLKNPAVPTVAPSSDVKEDDDKSISIKIVPSIVGKSTEVELNLDDLSRTLEGHKNSEAEIAPLPDVSTSTNNLDSNGDDTNNVFAPKYFINKMFGAKKRQTHKPNNSMLEDKPEKQMNNISRFSRGVGNMNFEGDSITNEDNELSDVDTLHGEHSDPKHGYVSINVVPQPTAIVKLRDNTTKKSKIKRFFNKFRLHKKRKGSKKVKRSSQKRKRFNPIKKLKNMFNVKSVGIPAPSNFNFDDYEMRTSHIEGFKSNKYDKQMSVADMLKQIPNITDFSEDVLLKLATDSTRKMPIKDMKWMYGYTFSDDQLIDHHGVKHIESDDINTSDGINENEINKATSDSYGMVGYEPINDFMPETSFTTTARPAKHRTTTKRSTLKTRLLLTEFPVKTLKPFNEQFLKFPTTESTRLMTLEDLNNEIEKIQGKLFNYRNLQPFSHSGNDLFARLNKKSSAMPVKHITSYSKVRPVTKEHLVAIGHLEKSNLKCNENVTLIPHRRDQMKHLIASLYAKPDIKIQGEMTRVVKFPMEKYQKDTFRERFNDFSGDYVGVEEPAGEYKIHDSNTAENRGTTQVIEPIVTVTVTQLMAMPSQLTEPDSSYKLNSDYFNDLLLWHDDILSADKVTKPSWRKIIDSIDENNYTTPNVMKLASELSEMNGYLKLAESGHKTTNKYNDLQTRNVKTPQNNGLIKVLAMNDKALANSEGIRIAGEAKYFKFNKPAKFTVSDGKHDLLEYLYDDTGKGVNTDYRRNTGPSEEPSDILVDTTLLAYDDDIMNILDDIGAKKITRNSLNSATAVMKLNPYQPVLTKTNKQPKQYFTTPLPMNTNELEKFLKQNYLDVESVTTPVNVPPSYMVTLNHKAHASQTSNSFETDRITEDKDTKSKLLYNSTKQRQIKNNGITKNDMRPKRFSEKYMIPSMKEKTKQKKYYNKIKEKLFVPKYTTKLTKFYGRSTLDNVDADKEIEITIINLDDKKATNSEEFLAKSTRNLPIASDFIYETKKPKYDDHFSHNKLLYNSNDKLGKTVTSKVVVYTPDLTKPDEAFHNDKGPYNLPLSNLDIISNPDDISHLFNNKHPPKRVHISGHSYQYDVFYGHDKFGKTSTNNYNNLDKMEHNTMLTMLPDTPSSMEPPLMYLRGLPNNSDLDEEGRRKKGVRKYKRIYRNTRAADTYTSDPPAVGSLIYNLKATEPSTIVVSPSECKGREKRLNKILTMLQDKIKSIRKHSSTTNTTDQTNVQEHKTNILDISTSTEALIQKKTTKRSKKLKKSEDSRRNKTKKWVEDTEAIVSEIDKEHNDYDEQQQVNSEPDVLVSSIEDSNPKFEKRDVQTQNIFTAKDVAALDIIVDLMKTNINYEDKDISNSINRNCERSTGTTKFDIHDRDPLNSIEVHIAIPYELQNSKRSLDLEPLRVRKVFSAKMSTPVDLEYQVNSYEGISDLVTPTTPGSTEAISPGMYLLVNKSDPKNGILLKPVPASLNEALKQKELSVDNTRSDKVETTNTKANKDGVRVSLSKDFLAAVNKQIFDLFGNVTIPPRKSRDVNTYKLRSTKDIGQKSKSLLNWEAIKRFFGHDRVCYCKCKPYKAMCRACAASDAVINELIFEFDNLAEYMKEHCTEIQTFFWMNPTGGKKLRDAVHKIDTSIKDYYKRVKGKCQGRTCKTFSTFIDKREYKEPIDVNQDVGGSFLENLEILADDVHRTTKIMTCFSKKLKDKSDNLIQDINIRLNRKLLFKRQDSTTKKAVKNVYSLDNINVNIICNPKISSSTENYDIASLMSLDTTQIIPHNILNALDISLHDIKKHSKKHKGFKKLFTKKPKLFTYYIIDNTLNLKKRDVNQIESPLISDSGGTFWYDYIKGKTSEPRIVRETKNKVEPNVGITVIQTKSHKTNMTTTSNKDNLLTTIPTSPKTLLTRDANTPDLLSYNLNQLLKLFSSADVEEVVPYYTNSNVTTTVKSDNKTDTTKTKKPKKVKPNKTIQKIKDKHCKSTINNIITTNSSVSAKTENISVKFPISMEKKYDISSPIATEAIITNKQATVKHTSKGFFNKIIENLTKGNFIIDEEKLTTVKDRKRYTSVYSDDNETIATEDLTNNPTIMIINDAPSVPDKKSNDEYNNLLLSIIEKETNNLNEEWLKFAYKNVRDSDKEISKPTKTIKSTKPHVDNTNSEIDYDIVKSLKNLELPEPQENTKSNRLLDKLANKIGIKVLSGNTKMKAGKKHIGVVTQKSGLNTITTQGDKDKKLSKEACDISRQICDIQATYDHIMDLYDKLPAQNFENYIRNITCYKYRPANKFLYIEYPKKDTKWDWIRRKRSLRHTRRDNEFRRRAVSGIRMDEEVFEKFVKGDDGIYRIKNREKRTTSDLKDLLYELRNIAPLNPAQNEICAMLGDTVTIDCLTTEPQLKAVLDQYSWSTEREDMLLHENVIVEGSKITISNTGARNDGTYSCTWGDSMIRNFKLCVVTLPEYIVVFSPSYSCADRCGDYELKALQLLGPVMCREMSCGSHCAARIDEPMCRRARGSSKFNVELTAVLNISLGSEMDCSVQCRRDLMSSLTMLIAQNVPALSKIGVVIGTDGRKKILLPSRNNEKTVITHTLRKNDSNGHHEYHRLASRLAPGDVDVVLSCPAGFYLMQEQKICAACPANSSSSAGDNVCSASGHGGRSVPATESSSPLRRYDWWWRPGCGYVVACGGVGGACCACCALALLGHVTSRDPTATPSAHANKKSIQSPRSPRARPLSPSRVILARFFKPSLTSSRATDSQETKFELWKKNRPPPLPPVDFDI